MWYQQVSSMFFHFVTKHVYDEQTDRWMDRQNYDSQDCASIAALLSNKQVAQLWQRDRAKLALLSINVKLYLLNHKIAFLSHFV